MWWGPVAVLKFYHFARASFQKPSQPDPKSAPGNGNLLHKDTLVWLWIKCVYVNVQSVTFEKSQGTTKGQPYLLGSRQDQWTNGTLRSCSKAWLFSHACFKARNWLCVSVLGSKRKKDHIRIQTFINQRYLFSKFPIRKLAKFCLYGVLYVTKCKKRNRFHETSLQKYTYLLRNPWNRSLWSVCLFFFCPTWL